MPRVGKVALIVRGAAVETTTIVIIRAVGGVEDTITLDTGTQIGQRVLGTVDFNAIGHGCGKKRRQRRDRVERGGPRRGSIRIFPVGQYALRRRSRRCGSSCPGR